VINDKRRAALSGSPRPSLSRRTLLAGATATVAGLGVLAVPRPGWARSGELPGDPFTLGVASGDPAPDGVVLWTRLAPDPFAPDGGMPDLPVLVDWQVAHDTGSPRSCGPAR
jgi:alkaline phosphatase D